jgi:hypothetical protein
LVAPTRSNSAAPGGNPAAAWSVVAGALAVAVIPVAVAGTRWSNGYELLEAGYFVPLAVLLGVAAVILARRARVRDSITLGRAGGRGASRVGRALGILGICIGAAATVSLLVYWVLNAMG